MIDDEPGVFFRHDEVERGVRNAIVIHYLAQKKKKAGRFHEWPKFTLLSRATMLIKLTMNPTQNLFLKSESVLQSLLM